MRRRHPWLLPVLLVALVALPIFEIWLLIQIGQQIGLLATLLILLAGVVIGGWLLRREGRRAWRSLNEAFQQGRLPAGELADAVLVFVGAVLVMLPGLLTDVIGLIFLLPFTRPLARRLLGATIARRFDRAGATSMLNVDGTVVDGTVVDGTVVDGTGSDDRSGDDTDSGPDQRIIRGTIEPPR